MSVDFSVGLMNEDEHPSWTYSWFADFRTRLAAQIGITLKDMQGYSGGTEPWDAFEDDDICLLLQHSDCGGNLRPDRCAKIIPRLRELLPCVDDDEHHKHNGALLLVFMERCVADQRPLLFR